MSNDKYFSESLGASIEFVAGLKRDVNRLGLTLNPVDAAQYFLTTLNEQLILRNKISLNPHECKFTFSEWLRIIPTIKQN